MADFSLRNLSALAEMVESDRRFLAEMVQDVLPLRLPLGLPAPGPVWGSV